MPNFIAVDCGKYDTKVNALLEKSGEQKRFKIRTKMSPGVFEDDMIKRGTMIVQVDDGPVYTYGYGAVGEPSMETSKKSEIHKIGALAGIAAALGAGEYQDIYVAIGVPLDISGNALERIAYKDYILGTEGETHTVRIKRDSEGPITTTTFSIKKRYVYPEGSGILWVEPKRMTGATAIIDIGNLNTNNLYCESLNPEDRMCFTGELGGRVLITNIASMLEAELGHRVIESMVASALAKPYAERHLVSTRGDKSLEERSGEIIANYAYEHVRMIKQQCDVHHWPLEYSNIVCVGGTTKLLTREITEVFGENVYIPENQEYANVCGFLKRMCATLGVDVDASEQKRKSA